MGFRYGSGNAASIAAWFAVFETFIKQCGWTIEAGAGTTNLIVKSIGTSRKHSKLYANIFRDIPANPTYVKSCVQDDLAGTHKTTSTLTYCEAGAGAFDYWMCGDADAFVYCFKLGANYDAVYAGLLMPFAQISKQPDNTYFTVATCGIGQGRILRDYAGAWDQSFNLTGSWSAEISASTIIPLDNTLPLGGIYAFTGADGKNVAGQFKHITCRIQAAGVAALDTGTGGDHGNYIFLLEQKPWLFGMRTGGKYPVGSKDGAVRFANGISDSFADFDAAIQAFLAGIGWTITPIVGGGFYAQSTGELGGETIVVRIIQSGGQTNIRAQDDLAGTHVTSNYSNGITNSHYPCNYWVVADRNWIAFVQGDGKEFTALFAGIPKLSLSTSQVTPYKVIAGGTFNAPGGGTMSHLRGWNGLWNQGINFKEDSVIVQGVGSSPNAYDGKTYVLCALYAYSSTYGFIGEMPYMGYVKGGSCSQYDEVKAGKDINTVFYNSTGLLFTLRTQ